MNRFILNAAVLCVFGSSAFSAPAKPNIVFFLADDQRFDQMSCAGHPYLKTPHLDRLAAEGVRFRNAYVTVSLCGPNRACIMTGLYSHANGVRKNWDDVIPPEIPILPQLLQQEGYESALIGKWHMPDLAQKRDFDFYFSFKGQGIYFNPKILEGARNAIRPEQKFEGHMDDILGDAAVRFLKQKHEKPFILFVWFKGVHRPWDPPERYKDLYREEAAKLPEPATFNDDYAGRPEPIRLAKMRVEETKDTTPWREFVRKHNATMKGVDDNIGKVLAALDATGLAKDTMVIHSSDNGFFHGEHHLFDKRLMYEESVRVPLLVRWPGQAKPGTTVDAPVLSVDHLPAILDAARAAGRVPRAAAGRSWLPLLRGETPKDWRRRWWYEYDEFPDHDHFVRVHRGVKVEERWKFIVWITDPGGEELYDLQTDPTEMKNLVNDPGSKDLLARMRKEFKEAKEEAGDPIEISAMKAW